MAKPKVKVLVKVFGENALDVWGSSFSVDDILSIEGVSEVYKCTNNAFVICDPRYDTDEIAQEIRDLLLAEVPDIFKDNDYGLT